MHFRPLCAVLPLAVLAASPSAWASDAAWVYARAKDAVVTVRTSKESGTGFVIGDGSLVLTCAHVVKGASWVRTDETGAAPVHVVGIDGASDVALLRLPRPRRDRLSLRAGSGSAPGPGTKVYVIGTSLGFLDHTLSEGIVSGRRQLDGLGYLQISAPVSHGNSGGPVLDEWGGVIGMTDFSMEEGQSLNFALSSEDLQAALSRIQVRAAASEKARRIARETAPSVLGKLARATRDTAVYREPGRRAPIVGRVPKGRYLVARPARTERWTSILLNDRKVAYVPTDAVEVLNFEVTQSRDGTQRALTKARAGETVACFAMAAEGTKYVPRGTSLTAGVGNGEFVRLAYAQAGRSLPASPAAQAKIGDAVTRYEELAPGDRLYLWDDKADRIGQVAIYVGGGYATMADPKRRQVVRFFLTEAVRKRIVAARGFGI